MSGLGGGGAAEQLQFIRLEPEALIADAKERWKPIRTYCMFSGGNDSMVVAHRLQEHYDELFFIDTGTAVDEDNLSVVAHVERAARWLGKPLTIIAAGDAYEQMILGGARLLSRGTLIGLPEPGIGLPGPGMHGRAYNRLKERQIEELARRVKTGRHRLDNVLLLSGVHRKESRRRAKRMPLTEAGSKKFVNPLIDWTPQEFDRYRLDADLPGSDISALLHRSGECNCGAFARASEEAPMLKSLFPKTWSLIDHLEAESERKRFRWCRWGGYDLDGICSNEVSHEPVGMICDGCDAQLEMELPALSYATRPLDSPVS